MDLELLHFLAHEELPEDPDRRARVAKAAKYFTLDDMGRLWAQGTGESWLRVPWLKDRASLIREVHREASFCSGDKLFQLLRSKYFWHGMRAACL